MFARSDEQEMIVSSIRELAQRVVSESLQIHGANGYQRSHPLEIHYRLVRGHRLAAGTDEIQKNQIATVLRRDGVPDV